MIDRPVLGFRADRPAGGDSGAGGTSRAGAAPEPAQSPWGVGGMQRRSFGVGRMRRRIAGRAGAVARHPSAGHADRARGPHTIAAARVDHGGHRRHRPQVADLVGVVDELDAPRPGPA